MDLPSKLLERAVEQFASLPGVGRKTALRLTLHLLNRSEEEVNQFAEAFSQMRQDVKFCKKCHNISDAEICSICKNPKRDAKLICVVEDLRDIIALENTGQFNGLYHVLGGHISPMDGIGPNDLNIASLIDRVRDEATNEVILALSTTMEGDTTNFYLYKKLAPLGVSISTIARGVAVGDVLEYTDEITLGRSIVNRTPYESTLSK
ncbi:MAG: recombination protein RecR [Crocinitomicaceae bacterium]|nr:recombination protein RecR [Crocinitomicaceae bacterium]|tara:strand:- start:724 stop:1341 length:618 start_codon:yes stop_codon:yes gene_type:complete